MLLYLLFSTLWSIQYLLHHWKKRTIIGVISQQLNEYRLDLKVENRRWKSMQNWNLYIYIILWYDQNWNA